MREISRASRRPAPLWTREKMAALTALRNLDLLGREAFASQADHIAARLAGLRSGPFGKAQAAKNEIMQAYALRK
jgi:hypothetical protein